MRTLLANFLAPFLSLRNHSFLLSYDALALHTYLESIIHSNTVTEKGVRRLNQSPWLFLEAADVMIKAAKRRCYITTADFKVGPSAYEFDPDEEDWNAYNDAHGIQPDKKWLPKGMEPVLEELPKWPLLVAVLQEIEETILAQPLAASECTR